MFCYFAPLTRHSFQAMCAVFSRKDFYRLFDGLLRISTRKTNAEPRCLTSLGGHVGAIWAAKDLELVHVHHLANPYTDLTNSLRGTKYFLRETNTVFGDTNNSLWGTKYFLWETNTIFQDTNNSLQFGEPNMFFGKWIVSLEQQISLIQEDFRETKFPSRKKIWGMGTLKFGEP